MRWIPCLLVTAAVSGASAQADLNGKNDYPQFRTFSGLPGSLYGLTPTGLPSFRAAMGISTPVAYSLYKGHFAAGVSNMNVSSSQFAFTTQEANANGTAWFMGGFGTPYGNLTVGGMVLSRIGDSVLNLHFQPRLPHSDDRYTSTVQRFDFGVGVQDAFNTGGATGQGLATAIGAGNSQSFYVVGTGRLTEDLSVSAGTGTHRFQGLFANASYNIHRKVKLVAEYDAFNFNYGLAFDLGSGALGKDSQVNAFVGHIRGKYLMWGIGIAF